MNILSIFLACLYFLPIVIYIDAARNNIGHQLGRPRGVYINWSAFEIAMFCNISFVLGSVIYGVRRRCLLDHARKVPCRVENVRWFLQLSALLFLACWQLLIFMSYRRQ